MKYNLKTPEDAITFFCNLKQLIKTTVVWPHPEELLLSGCKMQGYQNIRLAALSLGFHYPMYATIPMDILDDNEFQKRLQQGILGVLKRDYGMKAECVITPRTKDPLKHLKAAIKQQEETWGRVAHFFPRPNWFVQPIIDNLFSVGEIKAFIIGGHLTLKITTTATFDQPSAQITDHSIIRPIDIHRSVFKILTLL